MSGKLSNAQRIALLASAAESLIAQIARLTTMNAGVPDPMRISTTSTKSETESFTRAAYETVNHPKHYTAHPSGVECIDITEHMNFNLGNAIKYIWRAPHKGNYQQDLRKAIFYLERECARLADRPQASNGTGSDPSCEQVEKDGYIPFA